MIAPQPDLLSQIAMIELETITLALPPADLGTVESVVDAEEMEALALKGFYKPVPAYNVRGIRA